MDYRALLLEYLACFLFPLWLIAGVADYLCHRWTDIGHTSGLKESALHVVQALEVGVPLLAGLLLEINALVLAVMIAGVIAHSLTAVWDVSYTAPRRHISPFEQHVHSYLEFIPVMAVSVVALLHWEQFAALFGQGVQEADFSLRLKREPIPSVYLGVVLGLIGGLELVPLIEEFWRSWRQRTHAGSAQTSVRM
jgi:hypothetical protein